jgi:hypothetical protein
VVAADTFSITPLTLMSLKNVVTPVMVAPPPTTFNPLRDVVTPVMVAPPPTTLSPLLAVTTPTESILVTSS